MKTKLLVLSYMLLSSIGFISCKKNITSTSNLQVKLTDSPVSYDEVNVDIQAVKVNFRDDSTGWVSLNTNAKVYNLLALQNGVEALLASGTVQTGTVKEIRLILVLKTENRYGQRKIQPRQASLQHWHNWPR